MLSVSEANVAPAPKTTNSAGNAQQKRVPTEVNSAANERSLVKD